MLGFKTMINNKPLIIINEQIQQLPTGNMVYCPGGTVILNTEYSSLYSATILDPAVLHSEVFTTTKDNAFVMLIYKGLLVAQGETGISQRGLSLNFNIDDTPVFQNPQWGGANYWQNNSGCCITLVAFVQVPTAGEHTLDLIWASFNQVNYIFVGENAMSYNLATNRGISTLTAIEY
jgi:hypothetical protein